MTFFPSNTRLILAPSYVTALARAQFISTFVNVKVFVLASHLMVPLERPVGEMLDWLEVIVLSPTFSVAAIALTVITDRATQRVKILLFMLIGL